MNNFPGYVTAICLIIMLFLKLYKDYLDHKRKTFYQERNEIYRQIEQGKESLKYISHQTELLSANYKQLEQGAADQNYSMGVMELCQKLKDNYCVIHSKYLLDAANSLQRIQKHGTIMFENGERKFYFIVQ